MVWTDVILRELERFVRSPGGVRQHQNHSLHVTWRQGHRSDVRTQCQRRYQLDSEAIVISCGDAASADMSCAHEGRALQEFKNTYFVTTWSEISRILRVSSSSYFTSILVFYKYPHIYKYPRIYKYHTSILMRMRRISLRISVVLRQSKTYSII